MKKRRIVLIVILVATLLLASVGGGALFLHATKGEIYLQDGFYQNDRVYVKDISYSEDGLVRYTVVNDSSQTKYIKSPHIEQKVNGEWRVFFGEEPFLERCARKLSPFSETSEVLPIKQLASSDGLVGEYRFVYGDFIYDDTSVPMKLIDPEPERKQICIVGYFAITEDMLG